MKIRNLIAAFNLMFIMLLASSCTAIADIFKAGMGFGIFVVIAVVVVIVGIAMKARKK